MISIGTVTKTAEQEGKGNYSFTHVTASNTNLLVVVVMNGDGGGKNSTSSVTFNGDALTAAVQKLDSGDNLGVSIWYRVNPDIGSYTVAVDVDDSANSSYAYAMNITDASVSAVLDDTSSSSDTGSPSTAGTVEIAPALLIDAFVSQRTSNLTVDASQTLIGQNTMTNASNFRCGASWELSRVPGDVTMSWSGTSNHAHAVAVFTQARRGGGLVLMNL